ncbi:MAG: tyrosine-type recombinase/integrase [bacterium]
MAEFNWVLDQGKFLTSEEVSRLLCRAKQRAEQAQVSGCKVAVRDYMVVLLALETGLRVMEIAGLNCGDVHLDGAASAVMVRRGKGGKRRIVRIGETTRDHLRWYLVWKEQIGEPTGQDYPLLMSSNTGQHMTTRAIQKAFKRTAARASLPSRYSIHCLRHTYACELYRASGYNLRLVQKQLGHASIRTTEVYADVMNPELERSLERLYA